MKNGYFGPQKKADEMLSSVLRSSTSDWYAWENGSERDISQVSFNRGHDADFFIFEVDENGYAHIWKHWKVYNHKEEK